MQHNLELDSTLYAALEVYARTIGTTPQELACQLLRKQVFGSGTAPSEAFERNQEAYYRMLPELLQTHEGHCVAFRNGELVATGSDRIALLKEMYIRYGYSEIFVTEVTGTLRVRHVGHRQLIRRP